MPPRRTDIIRNSAKYSVAEKQFEKDLKSGASVKTLYCDTNADGFPDVLLRKYRNPSVNKAVFSCQASSPPPPITDTDGDGVADEVEAYPLDNVRTQLKLDSGLGVFNIQYSYEYAARPSSGWNNPDWASNTSNLTVDASFQGGEIITTTGITSPIADQAAVRNVELEAAPSQGYSYGTPVPITELYARDLRGIIPGWPYAVILFMRTPVPYFDENYHVTHYPFAHSGYFPLYTSTWEANYRAQLSGVSTYQTVSIQIPMQDPAFGYDNANPSIAGGNIIPAYLPNLPLADANTDPKDFTKRWDPVNGIAHPGYAEDPYNSGILWNGVKYDHEGNVI